MSIWPARRSPEGLRMSGEAWQCPGCASRVAPWRRLRILRSPEILVVTLKRWDTELVEAAMWKRRMGSVWRYQVVSLYKAKSTMSAAWCTMSVKARLQVTTMPCFAARY